MRILAKSVTSYSTIIEEVYLELECSDALEVVEQLDVGIMTIHRTIAINTPKEADVELADISHPPLH